MSSLPYNQLRQKSAHNVQSRKENLEDVLTYHRIRSIEFDLHNGSSGVWECYHTVSSETRTVKTLAGAVKALKNFHNTNPDHEVITVWVDFHDTLDSTHTPAQFDAIIDDLPLWTPADAKGAASSIKAGIDTNGWPSTSTLKGKFIWVITKNQVGTSGTYVIGADETAREANANTRKAFVSHNSMSSFTTSPYKVFYNQGWGDVALGSNIYDAGYIGRVYRVDLLGGGIDTSGEWTTCVNEKFHHIATDQINFHEDTWCKTHNSYGYPFQSLNGTNVSSWTETTPNVICAYVDNGDIWGNYDDFSFRYRQETGSSVIWTAQIANVNSQVDDWAKGCLMVRHEVHSDDYYREGSPYFAIVRGADNKVLRIQYRTSYQGSTSSVDAGTLNDGIDETARCYVKLEYSYSGGNTTCSGYWSDDGGTTWRIIGSAVTFTGKQLQFHGLGASSHDDAGNADGSKVKHLFVNIKKNGTSQSLSDFPNHIEVGNDNSGTPVWNSGFF